MWKIWRTKLTNLICRIHSFKKHRTFTKTDLMLSHKGTLNILYDWIVCVLFSENSKIQLEINNKKITRNPIVWDLSKYTSKKKTSLIKKEITMEIINYLKFNFNNILLSNLWKAAKAVFKKNFLALNTYIGKRGC